MAGMILLLGACSTEPPPPCRPLDEAELAKLIEKERVAVESRVKSLNKAVRLYEEAYGASKTGQGSIYGELAYEMSLYGPDSSDWHSVPDGPLPAAEAATEYAELTSAATPDCEFLQPRPEWDHDSIRVLREHVSAVWRAAHRVNQRVLEAELRAVEAAGIVNGREAMLRLARHLEGL